MARTSADTTETTEVAAGPVLKRVIINKPQGVTDSHLFIGFNEFEGQFAFDTPVNLPAHVVKHLRSIKHVQYRPDESGKPVRSEYAAYSIVEADE